MNGNVLHNIKCKLFIKSSLVCGFGTCNFIIPNTEPNCVYAYTESVVKER